MISHEPEKPLLASPVFLYLLAHPETVKKFEEAGGQEYL
jgi:hypothetical protein